MGSSSRGVICVQKRVQWVTGSEDRRWVTLVGQEVCFGVGAIAGITLGEQGDTLSVWTWGSLVGTAEGIGGGS